MPNPFTSPTVSAIIVARNSERFLAHALRSIARQSHQPNEIIVVDGQSTDGTAAIARSFAGVRYILQPDLGIARARNLAIETTAGEFIAFLDADDLWLPHKLAVQLEFMLARPQLMYTTTLLNLFYEPGCAPRPGYREEGFTTGMEGRFPGTMLARREVFQQIGPFNPDFALAFEVDWFARAQDAGIPSALVEEILLHKRIHAHNNSIRREQFRREWFVVMRRSLTRKRTTPIITAEP